MQKIVWQQKEKVSPFSLLGTTFTRKGRSLKEGENQTQLIRHQGKSFGCKGKEITTNEGDLLLHPTISFFFFSVLTGWVWRREFVYVACAGKGKAASVGTAWWQRHIAGYILVVFFHPLERLNR